MTGMYRASLKQEGITPHEEKLIELEVCKRVKIHSKELKQKYRKIYSKKSSETPQEEEVKSQMKEDSEENTSAQIPKNYAPAKSNQKLEDYIEKLQTCLDEKDYYKKYQDKMKTAISDINSMKNYSIFEGIINAALGSCLKLDKNTVLNIDLNKEESKNLVHFCQLFELPIIKELRFFNVHKFKSPAVLNNFLENTVPSELLKFSFRSHFSFKEESCLQYVDSLNKVLKNVKKRIEFTSFCFQTDSFVKIMISTKNCNNLNFPQCYFSPEEEFSFNDGLKGATFTHLNFHCTGKNSFWNKEKNETKAYQFLNIMKALAESEDVKEHLESINLEECEIAKEVATDILKKVGLEKVEINGV
mmetsp:Transcript_29295/g.25903  ORF Transcript_29295/g.25903 Transcript_29295/m.25903 type:complete len:359 (+) Transcript_29295:427-1503(+)